MQFYRVLNIRVALVGLEVWSDSDKCPITQDPFTTLHEFLDWRKVKLLPQKPHDNAQLIRWTSKLLNVISPIFAPRLHDVGVRPHTSTREWTQTEIRIEIFI